MRLKSKDKDERAQLRYYIIMISSLSFLSCNSGKYI